MKILSLILLLSAFTFGQSGKSVLTDAQKDSIGQMIRDSSIVFNVKSYGAIGDSLTDETTTIQGIWNLASDGDVIYYPEGKYRITSSLTLTNKTLYHKGSNATIIGDGTFQMFVISGSLKGATTTIADTITPYRNYAVFTDASDYTAGDLVTLISDSAWQIIPSSVKRGEIHTINKITNDTVYFNEGFWDTYSSADEIITVKNYNIVSGGIDGLNFTRSNLTGSIDAAIYLWFLKDFTINNVSVKRCEISGIIPLGCINTIIQNSSINGSNQYGLGYGISVSNSYNTKIFNNSFIECAHGIDVTSSPSYFPSRVGIISNNYFDGGGMSTNTAYATLWDAGNTFFSTHGAAEDWTVINNQVTNVNTVFSPKGRSIQITNNKISGKVSFLVTLSAGYNFNFSNNEYDGLIAGRSDLDSTLFEQFPLYAFAFQPGFSFPDNSYFVVKGNKFYGIRGSILNLASGIVQNVVMEDNLIWFANLDLTEWCTFLGGSIIDFVDCQIKRNNVRIYTPFQSRYRFSRVQNSTFINCEIERPIIGGNQYEFDADSVVSDSIRTFNLTVIGAQYSFSSADSSIANIVSVGWTDKATGQSYLPAGIFLFGDVIGVNTVRITILNKSGTGYNPPNGYYKIRIQ